ncbi:hypothetical protein D8674_022532 [Pyrus ussuriensis x Pyrus communis]|uniref:Uncharacterized protein n=1 Tax=Pyrus ussuriensis x Pyrus communis TaxID=2448454 RepID=A0A5N5GYV3_9ROSA|nr:hypothetical protein D8674_022532 [Pyrus ussuriensis x Pyrus communis]
MSHRETDAIASITKRYCSWPLLSSSSSISCCPPIKRDHRQHQFLFLYSYLCNHVSKDAAFRKNVLSRGIIDNIKLKQLGLSVTKIMLALAPLQDLCFAIKVSPKILRKAGLRICPIAAPLTNFGRDEGRRRRGEELKHHCEGMVTSIVVRPRRRAHGGCVGVDLLGC